MHISYMDAGAKRTATNPASMDFTSYQDNGGSKATVRSVEEDEVPEYESLYPLAGSSIFNTELDKGGDLMAMSSPLNKDNDKPEIYLPSALLTALHAKEDALFVVPIPESGVVPSSFSPYRGINVVCPSAAQSFDIFPIIQVRSLVLSFMLNRLNACLSGPLGLNEKIQKEATD